MEIDHNSYDTFGSPCISNLATPSVAARSRCYGFPSCTIEMWTEHLRSECRVHEKRECPFLETLPVEKGPAIKLRHTH